MIREYYEMPAEARGNNTVKLNRIRYRGGSWAYYLQPGTAEWDNGEYVDESFEPDPDIREVVRSVDDHGHYSAWLDEQDRPEGQDIVQHIVSRTLEYIWASETGAFDGT